MFCKVPDGHGTAPNPVLPKGCSRVAETRPTTISRWKVDCGAEGLRGHSIGFSELGGRSTTALARVLWADGSISAEALTRRRPLFVVPQIAEVPPLMDTVARYLELGVEHILLGIDHLLFVLCLTLLVGHARRLLAVLTAFTVAHSITLALASLQLVQIPGPPVEALIAFSIVLLAGEVWARRGSRSVWTMAFLFGLLHGLGFAGALAEAGLPPGRTVSALLTFNVGVELGQAAFVGVLLGAAAILGRITPKAASLKPYLGAAAGCVGGYWLAERVYAIWIG